jgi:hypothetical protein
MGASLTVYCLENVTDYFEFERLGHDIMSRLGYQSIEPLGGFKDKGRDAVHISQTGETTLFAYSVREDWRAKLAEDTHKIHKHGHACDKLVFITTSQYSSGERDEAIQTIKRQYGWTLDLFGIERLRVLLDANFPDLKPLHPQVFPPEFLALQAKSTGFDERTHILINCSKSDRPLADWLTRKLTFEGYRVWSDHFKQLDEEVYPTDLDGAISKRAFIVVALYSPSSLSDPELIRQRAIALGVAKDRNGDFLIPLSLGVAPHQLDRQTASLKFIDFTNNWATGLQQLLSRIETTGCPKPLLNGRGIVAEAIRDGNNLITEPETILSNSLKFERIPEIIYLFEAGSKPSSDEISAFIAIWSFRKISPEKFLSFHPPPSFISSKHQFTEIARFSWGQLDTIEGISVPNLVSELLRKALIVKCHEKGLVYCPSFRLNYFPKDLLQGDRLSYTRPDGVKSSIQVVGQRKFWRPKGSSFYRYYLAPQFWIQQNLVDKFIVLVQIRIRFSTLQDEPLSKRTALSRRKHLCKDWWNNDWLVRILAICRYLADEDKITIGDTIDNQIVINAHPLSLIAPVGINETGLDQQAYERSELLVGNQVDESSNESTSENE